MANLLCAQFCAERQLGGEELPLMLASDEGEGRKGQVKAFLDTRCNTAIHVLLCFMCDSSLYFL